MTAQVQAAKQAEASYNYSDALGIYQTLYAQHPDDVDLGMSLARNLRFSGQPAAEIGLVNQLMIKNGRSVPMLLELGKAYLAADQDNLALPTLLEAKGKEPNNWEVLSTLGVAYDYGGSYADARDAYAQALIASPSNPTVLNNLALSQASSGDLDGAIATLQQAIDQPAAIAQTRQNLALLLALKGDPNSAERLARKDLPPEIADSNTAYFRMISSAAGKGGGTPAPASAILPETSPSLSAEPASIDEPASSGEAIPMEPASATTSATPAIAPTAAATIAPPAIAPAAAATIAAPVAGPVAPAIMPATSSTIATPVGNVVAPPVVPATSATMVAPTANAVMPPEIPATSATMVAPANTGATTGSAPASEPAATTTTSAPVEIAPAVAPVAATAPAAPATAAPVLPILPVPSMAPQPTTPPASSSESHSVGREDATDSEAVR